MLSPWSACTLPWLQHSGCCRGQLPASVLCALPPVQVAGVPAEVVRKVAAALDVPGAKEVFKVCAGGAAIPGCTSPPVARITALQCVSGHVVPWCAQRQELLPQPQPSLAACSSTDAAAV